MASSDKFKSGDCVELKSGGPTMTVKGVGNYSYQENVVLCVWFDGMKKKEDTFVPESLKLV